ncbi:hypothetical protein PoB_006255000 [Plakobranchus ocellatus]|uniref:Uncharacterized protein n=1 Tax=Plakobranchus ocellatus TaxID=259542 RepID=A0AAV4CW02_9GAST|nr:hypothetical protein PoB_006255000 [Plakobranchus ocellatus]
MLTRHQTCGYKNPFGLSRILRLRLRAQEEVSDTMNQNNQRGPNANNNLHMNGPRDRHVQISAVVWRILTQMAEMVLRMYLTLIVVVYQWTTQMLSRVLAPLQPALDQARKVPKQDVSIQGIVYQYMRLVFLLVLYFSPWVVRASAYLLEPLRKLRDWAVDYVESPLVGVDQKHTPAE